MNGLRKFSVLFKPTLIEKFIKNHMLYFVWCPDGILNRIDSIQRTLYFSKSNIFQRSIIYYTVKPGPYVLTYSIYTPLEHKIMLDGTISSRNFSNKKLDSLNKAVNKGSGIHQKSLKKFANRPCTHQLFGSAKFWQFEWLR